MDSREKILTAAITVFAEKGKHGARMEEIASQANINKAMLYYFYHSKDNLYQEVLTNILYETLTYLYRAMQDEISKIKDPVEKLKLIIHKHFEAFSRDLNKTKIMLEAFSHDPMNIRKAMGAIKSDEFGKDKACIMCPSKFFEFFKDNISKKIFRKMEVEQFFISIMGMTLIYFIARPISQLVMDLDVKDEKNFLKQRLDSIIDLVLFGILEQGVASHVV